MVPLDRKITVDCSFRLTEFKTYSKTLNSFVECSSIKSSSDITLEFLIVFPSIKIIFSTQDKFLHTAKTFLIDKLEAKTIFGFESSKACFSSPSKKFLSSLIDN